MQGTLNPQTTWRPNLHELAVMQEIFHPEEVVHEIRTLLNLKKKADLIPIIQTAKIHVSYTGVFLSFKGSNRYLFGTANRLRNLIRSPNAESYPNLSTLGIRIILSQTTKRNPMDFDKLIQDVVADKTSETLRSSLLRLITGD